MPLKTFYTVVGFIFTAVGTLHVLRFFMEWPFMVGSWSMPLWMSIVGAIVAFFLAIQALKFRDATKK